MAVTDDMISQVRRMVAEPTEATYSDEVITAMIEQYPLMDVDGRDPEDVGWESRYDLNAVASDIWEEKAAALQSRFDFSADGGNFSRSQEFDQALKMASRYRSRRAIKTIKQIKKPDEPAREYPEIDNDETYYAN